MTWTRDSVRTELLKVFQHHADPGVDVTERSHLVADLGIDSLGVMEVIADLEDTFHLTIPDEALREVDTIGDVAKAVESRLATDGRLDG
jgi:acyl carrier protein